MNVDRDGARWRRGATLCPSPRLRTAGSGRRSRIPASTFCTPRLAGTTWSFAGR